MLAYCWSTLCPWDIMPVPPTTPRCKLNIKPLGIRTDTTCTCTMAFRAVCMRHLVCRGWHFLLVHVHVLEPRQLVLSTSFAHTSTFQRLLKDYCTPRCSLSLFQLSIFLFCCFRTFCWAIAPPLENDNKQ